MLIEFTEQEHAAVIDAARAAALPLDVPDWIDDLRPCPVCFNDGSACGYCGGGGDEQKPSEQPNQDEGGLPMWPDDVASLQTMAECDAEKTANQLRAALQAESESCTIECPRCAEQITFPEGVDVRATCSNCGNVYALVVRLEKEAE